MAATYAVKQQHICIAKTSAGRASTQANNLQLTWWRTCHIQLYLTKQPLVKSAKPFKTGHTFRNRIVKTFSG